MTPSSSSPSLLIASPSSSLIPNGSVGNFVTDYWQFLQIHDALGSSPTQPVHSVLLNENNIDGYSDITASSKPKNRKILHFLEKMLFVEQLRYFQLFIAQQDH